jgi:hypothetical protein
VVVPIFAAVFASESVAFRDDLTNKPNPAAPATPTSAVLRLNTEPAIAFKPLVAEPKPFLVLSNARIVMFTFSAIVLAHYLEVSQPLVKVTDRHLLCFFYAHMKAISQGQ